ncbi:TonB-dependent siderophore receptor [Neptuniibacter sp.]|uniref:TonB-dependent receptor plug domain-containing protein n=1 Tax=Neptuniibacter sp. TaxID=1962643 RepID=UPI002639FF59|nr:TonB-dependent receptor [Neptuniibacter sp.]MCP4597839.1 TonB-dependent receptor [Neptuniibacter sp.]
MFRKTFQKTLISIAVSSPFILSPHFVLADELSGFTEEDVFIDIPLVTSATHFPQKLTETPAAITIITQNMIEASGALNIPDLFRLVPGMQVFHVNSNKMGVTYHGMTDDFPSRMEVMINGRSIYIPLLSTVVWEALGISVDDVDHIEVVRGSNVPTHGSNAFLGAINIITKSPVSRSGTSVKATAGALGTENVTVRHSNSTEELQYTLSAGSLKNDGIDFYDDAGHSKFVSLSGSMTPNLIDTVYFDVGVTSGYAYRGDGNKSDLIQANFSPREHHSNYQDIRWNRILDNQAEFQLRYTRSYLDLETDNFDAAGLAVHENLPLWIADSLINANNGIAPKDGERGEVETHDIGVQYKASATTNIKMVTGSSFRYERAKSDVLLQNENNSWVDETSWKLYGNVEYRATDKITLNAGAMFEESSIVGGTTSFRTAVNYALSNSSTIRAAYSHAHRMPSLLEANSAYSVNLLGPVDIYSVPYRDMEPEEINSFEVGYLYIWPESSSQVEIRAFYEDVTDAIVRGKKLPAMDADGDLDISTNNADWINQGIEAQFKWESVASHQSSIVFNYSYVDSEGSWNRGYYPPETDRIVPLDSVVPVHTASILLSTKPTPSSLIGLSHYYMDHVEWLEGFSDKVSGRTNYTRTDLKLSNTFTLNAESEFELSLIIQNLFDKEYGEFYANNLFERRVYLQMGLTF